MFKTPSPEFLLKIKTAQSKSASESLPCDIREEEVPLWIDSQTGRVDRFQGSVRALGIGGG